MEGDGSLMGEGSSEGDLKKGLRVEWQEESQPAPIDVEVGEHRGRVEGGKGKEGVVMGGARFVDKGSE